MLNTSTYWKENLGNQLIPNRRPDTPEELIKLEYEIDGQTLTFTKNDLFSYEHSADVDLNTLKLPKNEIKFDITNADGRFNPDNPTGMYQKITEKQPVTAYYGIKVPATKTYTNIMPEDRSAYNNRSSIQFQNHMIYVGRGSDSVVRNFLYIFTPSESGLYYIGYDTWFEEGTQRSGGGALDIQFYTETGQTQYIISDWKTNPVAGQHYTRCGYYQLDSSKEYWFYCQSRSFSVINNFYCAPFIVKVDNQTDIPSDKMFLLDESYSIEYQTEEWNKAGKFYMSGWECPQNGMKASFTASSSLDFGKDKFGELKLLPPLEVLGNRCPNNLTDTRWNNKSYYLSLENKKLKCDVGGFKTTSHRIVRWKETLPAGKYYIACSVSTDQSAGYSTYTPTITQKIYEAGYSVQTETTSGPVVGTEYPIRYYAEYTEPTAIIIEATTRYFADGTANVYMSPVVIDVTDIDQTLTDILLLGETRGYQTGETSLTYSDLCTEAFKHINISSAQYSIDSSLDDYEVALPTPVQKYMWRKRIPIPVYTETPVTFSMQLYYDATVNYRTAAPSIKYVEKESDAYVKKFVYDFTDGQTLTKTKDDYTLEDGSFISETVDIVDTLSYASLTSWGNNYSGTRYKISTSYNMGDIVEILLSDSPTAYEIGLNAEDGYYYEQLGLQNIYTYTALKDTTDSAVIQYCANAAMCRIRYDVDGKVYIEPMDTEGELTDFIIDSHTSKAQPEYNLSKQIKNVLVNNTYTVPLDIQGENQQISNKLITSQLQANLYGGWLGRVINTRREITGDFHGDPRLQPYDYIRIYSKYALNEAFITKINIKYAGAFNESYTARVMKSIPVADLYGNYYAGDKQRAGNNIS